MTIADMKRHLSIDAVRGFAVLGILLINIEEMGLPSAATGVQAAADFWTWAVNNVFVDGKMRALFTMLFGASMVLIADRAEAGDGLGAAATHYRRMLWLLLFGIAHGIFFFAGDILASYAVAGFLVFPFRKLSPRVQGSIGAILLAMLLIGNVGGTFVPDDLSAIDSDALGGGDVGLLGGFMDAAQARLGMLYFQAYPFDAVPEVIGLMFIGMALFRTGFFTLGWSSRAYRMVVAIGYLIAVPFTVWTTWRIAQAWNIETVDAWDMDAWQQLSQPFIALAHAALLLLVVRAVRLQPLTSHLAAAGRMAFSNYLMTSVITSLVFCGYGLGLYGRLSRVEQLGIVAGIWVFILLWSRPWLERFHYGPLEWLWRSLVQWKLQPFAKPSHVAASA